MKNIDLRILIGFLVLFGCKSSSSVEEISSEISAIQVISDTTREESPYSQNDQENIKRLIQKTLTDIFKEDLEKGFLDSLSRQFKYSQVDLNEDGNLEILVGLTGPYFCGSGGCTVLLLTSHGDVITRFSVVKYPAYVDSETTNGWRNLIMYSGGENRVVKFEGETYPSNPSTLPVFEGDVDNLKELLDWENQEAFTY
ncbi:hypothetical protein OU792_17755 [Algoriphagus sp. NF]|uniref:Lipoprotein n=1 Tax=Algoriphagus marincola TaxID=264027 RepID=A0ABS7N5D8_9BACT|nr:MULTISPECIES: hypothetical protein [Algoriphagus]MBY5951557.1 hypothetical protein [Algoriphagus marincola]MDE0561847.1 hypothetical protein [Algoriphagus sp. NF]